VHSCILYDSQNKQKLPPWTMLADWFYNRNGGVQCIVRSASFDRVQVNLCLRRVKYSCLPATVGVSWLCHTNFTDRYATKQSIDQGVQEAVSLPVLEYWDSSLEMWISSSSSSSIIFHGVGPLVDLFRSHVSRSLFKGLPWFLLPVGQ